MVRRPARARFRVRRAQRRARHNVQLADHLGITKQAASELVQHLVDRRYLTREPDPADGRSRLLVLTERGRSCTRAAEQATAETVDSWRTRLTPEQFTDLQHALQHLAGGGRLRPAW